MFNHLLSFLVLKVLELLGSFLIMGDFAVKFTPSF